MEYRCSLMAMVTEFIGSFDWALIFYFFSFACCVRVCLLLQITFRAIICDPTFLIGGDVAYTLSIRLNENIFSPLYVNELCFQQQLHPSHERISLYILCGLSFDKLLRDKIRNHPRAILHVSSLVSESRNTPTIIFIKAPISQYRVRLINMS